MGATYTRQSSFTDGDVISAADSNDEFDQLLAAFQASSGHTHDGTANEGGVVTSLIGNTVTIGSKTVSGTTFGTLNSDTTLTFNSSDTNSGVLSWDTSADLFQFSDDILIIDNEQLIFGSDSNVAISYDETTTDSLKIAATEGAGLAITLMADEGDDAGDEWKLNIADGGTLTLGNDIASAGSYVTHLTLTPNSTVASSTLAVAGNLTVGGSLTLGSGAELAEAELEMLDGITAGTVAASKAMVVDANKDIGTVRNLTIDGTFSDGNYTFDTSGNVSGLGTVASGAITSSGIIKTDDATDATTTLDGSLQTDGGLSVAKDAILGNDVKLLSDSAVLSLGAGNDITFTHDGTTGLTIAATPISIDSTGELHLNSTTGDIKLQDGGVDQIAFDLDGTAGEVIIKPAVDSDDLVISQFDGTEVIRIEDNGSLGLVGNKLSIANSSSDVVIKPLTDAKDIIFQQYDGTVVATVEDDGTFNVPTGKLAINSTAITSTAAELNLLDTASANSVVNSKAVIYGSSGELAGTLSTAAQANITSVGTLTALTVDDVAVNGKVITMTGSSGDTFTTTVGTNGATSLVTVDTAAAAAHLEITADGTVDINSAGVLTLDSGAAINIEPASGSAILLDGTISIDAGVVTGATSITSTAFVGDITGDVTGTADVATVATTVTITDNESTNEDNAIIFTAGGDVDGGNIGLESDGTLTYNPSTGKVTATGFIGALTGAVTGNVAGNLTGTVATATQNSITTATGLVSVGALDSGSITSGFGNIDNGASNVTSGGLVKLDVDSDADDITGDSATGRLTIGAGEDLNLYHGGTHSYIVNDTGNLVINTGASNADIVFSGNDGGSAVTALTLDMSNNGTAIFNKNINLASDASKIKFGVDGEVTLTHVHDTGLILGGTTTSVAGALNVAGGAVFNEDSADVDFKIESNGNDNMFKVDGGDNKIYIGHAADQAYDAGFTPAVQIAQVGNTVYGGIGMAHYSNDAEGAVLVMGSGRATSVTGTTIVADGDTLGRIDFQGTDGSEFETGAIIIAHVDGTPGAEDMPGRLSFWTTADGAHSATERMRIASGGHVGIGLTNNTSSRLYVKSTGASEHTLYLESASQDDGHVLQCYSNSAHSGNCLRVYQDGASSDGYASFFHTDADTSVMYINRDAGDGELVAFHSAGGKEGSVSISGLTCSYNAFTGSHWSRLIDNSKPTILRGTVVETLDEMCDWYHLKYTIPAVLWKEEDEETQDVLYVEGEILPDGKKVGDVKSVAEHKVGDERYGDQTIKEPYAKPDNKNVGDKVDYDHKGTTYEATIEKAGDVKHVKCKISDTADCTNVYGVFMSWDNDDDSVNDMYVNALGTSLVRIHKDQTVSKGDLLTSNGDGTAKKQDDDIIRSKTIGKVLSNKKQETYDDGSYTVPCALYCG